TSQALEGIDVQEGESVLIADDPQKFARAVVLLLKNKELRQSLGKKAEQLIRGRYDWKEIMESVEVFYKEIIGK
ncbi:MAG: glycosyltransferase, partial [Candidatus Omnitrophica bacterium]|nr:glycosyltransferase [Candidatus Omnitrophota bacterium]